MAKEPWALLTSDWHLRLGGKVWNNHPELHGDVEFGLQQIQEYLEEYNPPTILLAGDILDAPKLDVNLVVLLNEFFNAYCDRRLILFVQGQHDVSEPTLIDAFCSRAVHANNRIFNDNGIRIHGFDYHRPRNIPNIEFTSDADVLLTHFPWTDVMGEFGIVDLPTTYKLVCSGDFHKNFAYKKGPTTLLSPGPLCMQRINEHPTHGVWLIYEDLSFELLPLKSRGYFEFFIKTAGELDAFIEEWPSSEPVIPNNDVPDAISKNIVRITYNPLIESVTNKLTATIGDSVHLFLKPGHSELIFEQRQVNNEQRNVVSWNKLLERIYTNHPCLGDAKQLLTTHTNKQLDQVITSICERVL